METANLVLKGRPDYFEALGVKRDDDITYVMLNLASSCVLSCGKCARVDARDELRHKTVPPLAFAEQIRFLDLAREVGAREMVIIGDGEPTQANNWAKLYRPIIAAAHDRDLGTILFTTAFFLTREQAEFCRDHDVTIIISLDTLDNTCYAEMYGITHWNKGNLQERVAQMLVHEPATHIRAKIALMKTIYAGTEKCLSDGRMVTRLGINTSIQRKNEHELDRLRQFAHEYGMYFIANYLMPEGRAARYENWTELVGSDDDWQRHKRLSAEKSDSGGHSSMASGVCNYFSRGIACDSRGYLITCGYASATAHAAENIRSIRSASELRWICKRNQRAYGEWSRAIAHEPSCPLREPGYGDFIGRLNRERLNIKPAR